MATAGSQGKPGRAPKRKGGSEASDASGGERKNRDGSGPVYFNSKAVKFWELSNFYKKVECWYQACVALRGAKKLFRHWLSCTAEKFVQLLQDLQPQKKNWTPKKLAYWFRDGQPIRGILFKLAANAVRGGVVVDKKRWAVLQRLAPGITPRPPKSEAERAACMRKCLEKKFERPDLRALLLSTGCRPLHEKPLRGKGAGNAWTYYVDAGGTEYGGDLLGKLLVELRAKLRQQAEEGGGGADGVSAVCD